MTGRFLGIKKSLLLKVLALLFMWGFVAYLFTCIFYFKSPEIWFYGFCLFLGGFELLKSFLFRFDSSLYLGSLLIFIGIVCFVFTYTATAAFSYLYIALAFAAASVFTFIFTSQRFHLIIAFSIIFVNLYVLLYVKNLITYYILIAFLVPFLLSLVIGTVFVCFHKK